MSESTTPAENPAASGPIRLAGLDGAIGGLAYAMTRGRDGLRYAASGRDLWVFVGPGEGGAWRADWRTMLDPAASPA